MLSRQGCWPLEATPSLWTWTGSAELVRPRVLPESTYPLLYTNHISNTAGNWGRKSLLSPFLRFFSPLPTYIPTKKPSPALGTCTRNQPYAWGPACPLSPPGRAAILKGPMPSLREETGERALDCATEITAVPRMPASFINFIAEKPIWLPCSVAR